MTPLNENAENRHRDLQNNRLGNELAELDHLDQKNDDLDRDLDNLQRQAAGEDPLSPAAAQRVAQADHIPEALAALDHWQFSYVLEAAHPDIRELPHSHNLHPADDHSALTAAGNNRSESKSDASDIRPDESDSTSLERSISITPDGTTSQVRYRFTVDSTFY